MSFRLVFSAACLMLGIGMPGRAENVPTPLCAAELNAFHDRGHASTPYYSTSGTVVRAIESGLVILSDRSGTTDIFFGTPPCTALPGDVIQLTGGISTSDNGRCQISGYDYAVIGSAAVPEPVPATLGELLAGKHDHVVVRVRGEIIDVMPDEIDSSYAYAILADGRKFLPISYNRNEVPGASTAEIEQRLRQMLGAQVEIVGYCNPVSGNLRRFHSRGIVSRLADMRLLSPAPTDPFDAPPLVCSPSINPEDVFSLGPRQVKGTVIVTWDEKNFCIQTPDNLLVRAVLSKASSLPAVGSFVRVVGYPETDLFNLNLSNAQWQEFPGTPIPSPAPAHPPLSEILSDLPPRHFNPLWHGRLVQLTGRIREVVRDRLLLACEGEIVHVNISSCADILSKLEVDAEIKVVGVCIMDIPDWRPSVPFPNIRGFTIIPRSAADLSIIARPPWWTPARLFLIIGLLLLVLCAILVWNRALRILAERRGRELAEERLAAAASELKVAERTRLAVELHDALSQTLAAISMQIEAVKRYIGRDPEKMSAHLDIAAKTLGSCQKELRNCLWDLRNSTLDDDDMTSAIRTTVQPHVGDAQISVRFNIPRNRFTDNTAHAILRIIRELAVNAVRHGKASRIAIAGSIEDGQLKVSVRDNGCGFNVETAPSIADGHFGLQGIRERIDEFGGELSITSMPGNGTRAAFAINLAEVAKPTEAT